MDVDPLVEIKVEIESDEHSEKQPIGFEEVYLEEVDTTVVKTEPEELVEVLRVELLESPVVEANSNQYVGERRYQCVECSFCVLSQVAMEEHTHWRHTCKSLMCTICKRRYYSQKVLEKHMRTAHDYKKMYTCSLCKFKCIHKNTIVSHNQNSHKITDTSDICMNCPLCFYMATDKTELSEHVQSHVKRFKCRSCTEIFTTREILDRHVRKTHMETLSKCGVCSKVFTSKAGLDRHKQLNHETIEVRVNSKKPVEKSLKSLLPFVCGKCGVRYATEAKLEEHRAKAYPKKSWYECKHCEFRTPTEKLIWQHVARVHRGSGRITSTGDPQTNISLVTLRLLLRFKCPDCWILLPTEELAKIHRDDVHAKPETSTTEGPKPIEKTYFCSRCGVRIDSVDSLRQHDCREGRWKVVAEEPEPQVPEVPNEELPNELPKGKKRKLSKLIKADPRYRCGECEYQGRKLADLKEHMTKHTGEKVCQCDFCGQLFSRTKYLTQHRRLHTEEKPYVCAICGYSAIQIGSLIYHQRNSHTVSSVEEMVDDSDDVTCSVKMEDTSVE